MEFVGAMSATWQLQSVLRFDLAAYSCRLGRGLPATKQVTTNVAAGATGKPPTWDIERYAKKQKAGTVAQNWTLSVLHMQPHWKDNPEKKETIMSSEQPGFICN